MIIPLGLTDEQEHIYTRMYKRCNFDSMEVRYTVQQLVDDSNKCFNLTTQKVRTILKFLIKNNYLVEVSKGSKGNPTTYKIAKIQQLNNNNLTINQQQSNNQNIVIKPFIDDKQQQSNNNLTTNQQLINNPINEKEKEKENIYIAEKEIFDYWNSRNGVIHSQDKTFDKEKTKIKTAIKTYGKDEILKAIERLCDAINDDNYYYNFQWNLFKFLKQSNGVSNWLDDGQLWNNYNQSNNSTYKPNNQQVKRYTFDENPF